LGVGRVLTASHRKNVSCYEIFIEKVTKRDTKFDTWNIRSLYRASSLTAAGQVISKISIRFSGCAGGYVGQRGHSESRGL